MFSRVLIFFSNRLNLAIILILISFVFTLQNIDLSNNSFWQGKYTFYNNYVIFKYSFFHLIENKNLYVTYSDHYLDLYKYSPTFALFMGLFAYLPDFIGLFLWNTLNTLVLYYSITIIKNSNQKQNLFLVLFILNELFISIQNSQSNALLVGLAIISFNFFEKNNPKYGTLFIALGVFIKLYSLLGFLLIFLYPNKIKSLTFLIIWSVFFLIIPLALVNFDSLFNQYINWWNLLKSDYSESIGMSIHLYISKIIPHYYKIVTIFLGFIILLTPLFLFKKHFYFNYRISYLSLVLITMVVFNHKAESSTFIIALTGVGIWYFNSVTKRYKMYLFWLCLLFTSFWFTDIIPIDYKNIFIDVKYIKPFMCIITLFIIFFEMINSKYNIHEIKAN